LVVEELAGPHLAGPDQILFLALLHQRVAVVVDLHQTALLVDQVAVDGVLQPAHLIQVALETHQQLLHHKVTTEELGKVAAIELEVVVVVLERQVTQMQKGTAVMERPQVLLDHPLPVLEVVVVVD
jgi:hypothetical protein